MVSLAAPSCPGAMAGGDVSRAGSSLIVETGRGVQKKCIDTNMHAHEHAYISFCAGRKLSLAHLHTELIKIHSVLHAPTPMSCLFLWIRRNKERNTFMIAVCLFIPNIARVMFLILKGRQSRWSIYYINVAVTFSFFTENKTTKKGLKKKEMRVLNGKTVSLENIC